MQRLNFLLPLVFCCFANAQQQKIYEQRDSFSKVIIMNNFDASAQPVRKNKKELFRELTDSLQVYLAENMNAEFGLQPVIVTGLVKADDSSILSIMRLNQAGKAIVIRSLEVYFDEGGEKHVEEYGSAPKLETNYNLCSKVDYAFYTTDSASQREQVNHCDYFTTRSVNDKAFVIKFGPDIVGKKRHTYGAVERNAIDYIQSLAAYLERPKNQ